MFLKRAAIALSALLIAAAPSPSRPFDPADNARVFEAVQSEVQDRYWDKARLGADWAAAQARWRGPALAATSEAQRYTALRGLLSSLHDSHVYAIGPTQVALQHERDDGTAAASFGFSFWREPGGQNGGQWRVLSVQRDGPAGRAGVQIGWQLVSIDGKPIEEDFRSALDRESTLRFLDDAGKPRTVTLRGALLDPEPERRATRLPGDVLLLALDDFSAGADRWINARLNEGPPPAAVVLDLRDNGGGDADAIARVAGRFFLERHTLLRRTRRDGFEDVPIARAGRGSYGGPLAVLVGPRSASGAEALAALVAESGRGPTVGERTSGALTGASEMDLPDGGLLSVAVFDVRTGAGARIEGAGFTPAYVVRPTLQQQRAGQDPVLDRALALLRAG